MYSFIDEEIKASMEEIRALLYSVKGKVLIAQQKPKIVHKHCMEERLPARNMLEGSWRASDWIHTR
jgi:hypothetical protein